MIPAMRFFTLARTRTSRIGPRTTCAAPIARWSYEPRRCRVRPSSGRGVTRAELECQIPPDAQDNNFLVKMPTLEEILRRNGVRHLRPLSPCTDLFKRLRQNRHELAEPPRKPKKLSHREQRTALRAAQGLPPQ
jgi:hypothetical protein